MADERLPCCRSESIAATRSDKVMSRPAAISFSPFQNASSRLTLVLWPAMTMERLTTEDFIARSPMSIRRIDDARNHLSAITAERLNAQNSFCAKVGLNLPARFFYTGRSGRVPSWLAATLRILCCWRMLTTHTDHPTTPA